MSTIGGLTGSTTSSIRGYGGLASGLDRDTLIEGMTSGTTSKITKQQQKKTQLEWQQAAVRSISDMMVSFANKFTSSWSSSTNLFSSTLWGRNQITTSGVNSKYVSVSGTSTSADALSIMGVKQLAQKAKMSSSERVSNGTLQTGEIDATKSQTLEELLGESLTFKYGDSSYTVFLNAKDGDDELSYDTIENAVNSINKLLEKEELSSTVGDKKTLADVIEVKANAKGDGFEFVSKAAGNSLYVTGGSALEYMGFEESKIKDTNLATTGSKLEGAADPGFAREVNFAEKIAGSSLSFNYNGVTKSIKIADYDTLMKGVQVDDKGVPTADGAKTLMDNLQKSLQTEMDKAFGSKRIEVSLNNDKNQLSFSLTNPTTGAADTSSTLTLTSGSSSLVGANGALNIKSGESTQLNLNAKLSAAGFKSLNGDQIPGTIIINGKSIEVKADDTMQSLMNRIKEQAGVTVSYQASSDKFTFTSNENGASGSVTLGVAGAAAGSDEAKSNDLLQKLFGIGASDLGKEAKGQDAIVTVKYAGSDEEVDLYRDSNTFTVNGLNINVKGEFGYKDGTEQAKNADGTLKVDANGKPVMEKVRDMEAEEVEVRAEVNADSIVDAVKSFIEEYNAIIEKVNKELSTKPDRDYSPLTSEQKKELSEDEIKLYEEKAKEGLLFGDSDLRNLSSDLRFIIGGGIAQELEKMGITTSSSYSDNGKLSFDESKFRAALASDPERVQEIFANAEVTNTNGNGTSTGIATKLKNVMDKYVNTIGSMETKGILIRKAGSESSPMSITENYIYKQIAEINKQITKLQTQLESERDRYIQQFTSLETLISQMNSQSSYLSQIGGSY